MEYTYGELQIAQKRLAESPDSLTSAHWRVLEAAGETVPDHVRLPEAQTETVETEDPKRQFDMFPRWLKYSGLPQILPHSQWATLRAVIELDYQTMGLQARRRGEGKLSYAAPQADVIAATGFSERAVRAALEALGRSKLLAYSPGYGTSEAGWGRWSTYCIGRETLRELFEYVAPMLKPVHGGISTLKHSALPAGGILVYGLVRHDPAIVSWERLYAIGRRDPAMGPYRPDPVEVARICEIAV